MPYYIVPSAEERVLEAVHVDPDLSSCIYDLIDLVDEYPHVGASIHLLTQLGANHGDEKCRRVAKAIAKAEADGTVTIPLDAKIIFCAMPSHSPTTVPVAVLIHVPGPPLGVTPPPELNIADIVTIVAVGGVRRQGGFF